MNDHDSMHRQTWDRIPWLVNDTLVGTQRMDVESHLRECASCREELAFQRNVHAGLQEDQPADEGAASDPLARLFERIDAEDAAYPASREFDPLAADITETVSSASNGVRRLRLSQLLAAAVIIEAIGLVGLGVVLAGRNAVDTTSRYATLSQKVRSAAPASIRLVPSPTMSVGQLQSLLDTSGLHIVGSNVGGRILALDFTPSSAMSTASEPPATAQQRVDAALSRLRANGGVLLAEPILSPALNGP